MRASVREQIICTCIEKKVKIVSSNVSYDEHRTCCRLGRMQQLFIKMYTKESAKFRLKIDI
jgi:hypothetical protein